MLREIHQLETFHCSKALSCRHQKEYQKDPDRLIKKAITGATFLGVWLVVFRNALKYKIKPKNKSKLNIHALSQIYSLEKMCECLRTHFYLYLTPRYCQKQLSTIQKGSHILPEILNSAYANSATSF